MPLFHNTGFIMKFKRNNAKDLCEQSNYSCIMAENCFWFTGLGRRPEHALKAYLNTVKKAY